MYQPIPFCIGMDVHFGFNGDRYPGQVIGFSKTGHVVCVRVFEPCNFRDHGPKEGDYACDFQPTDEIRYFTPRKDGSFREQGNRYCRLGFGMCYAQNPCI